MTTKIFTPVESMNPIYFGAADDELYQKILKAHKGRTFGEIKEDGYRMQVHKVLAFTRSMNSIELGLFPELNASLQRLPDCIIDAELIGDERIGHAGFEVVKKRFRSHVGDLEAYLASGVTSMPIALRVFDTLQWEGKDLVDERLVDRREYTEKIDEPKITPSVQRLVTSPQALKKWFEALTGEKYEGLVCKNPNSTYHSSQSNDWIKVKRSDSLDLAVLGVYLKKDAIYAILCGTYNPNAGRFETLAKVNATTDGLNKTLDGMLKAHYTGECPNGVYLNPAMAKMNKLPDRFVTPESSCVVEVGALNVDRGKNRYSCGLADGQAYSLRISVLKGIRDDKSVMQATTTAQVKLLYEKARE